MKEKEQYYHDPWEEASYRTGRTDPPKNRSGCIVFLLALVIVLGSICSILSLLNIHLFRQVTSQDASAPVGFTQEGADATRSTTQPPQESTGETGPVSIILNTTPTAVANIPQEGGMSLQDIYTKNIPCVASITCNTDSGTGVVISKDGYLVTNHHVIQGAHTIQVLLSDGRQLEAQVVGSDAICDLAVLHVQANDLTPAEFGDSSTVQVGDKVVAIGDPLGIELRGTMTDGIVSAINRNITTGGRTMTLLQTNAALNTGNSGGPLLNCYGQVIGINTMKIGDGVSAYGAEGLGFAIPSTTVKEVVEQLLQKGYVAGRPSLGITGQILSLFDQHYYRLPQGFYITQVDPGSSAAAVGLIPGDVLTEFDGVAVTDADTLKGALYAHAPGDTVTVKICRKGTYLTLEITLGEATSEEE